MGKRVAATEPSPTHQQHATPLAQPTRGIRKRKRKSNAPAATLAIAATASAKTLRVNSASNNYDGWHENDDEDSSSNDAISTPVNTANAHPQRNQSSKQANNSSILLNASFGIADTSSVNESPKPVYTLRPSVVNGTILYDLVRKPWRLGRPIGKGNFGEIFLASDNIIVPVTNDNAKFVVKIEPHSNGPLFVEIHCLMNTAKKNSEEYQQQPQIPPSGIPDYIASGSHYFGDARYRFLVLKRYDRDLHSLIKNCRVHQKSVLTLAIQIVNVLENMHDQGYCHNDMKAQNLMISKCKYYTQQDASSTHQTVKNISKSGTSIKTKYDEHYEEKQQTTDSGNSSEQEGNDEDNEFVAKRSSNGSGDEKYDEDDEDFDDGGTTNSNNSNSMDIYQTPVNKNRSTRPRTGLIEFSGSNPVRSCRRQNRNSIYEEMVKSHYLRPTKPVSYSELFNEDGAPIIEEHRTPILVSSDDESEEFVPQSARRSASSKKSNSSNSITTCKAAKRLTRRQEKLLLNHSRGNVHTSTTAVATTATTDISTMVAIEEERIFLIDFGLASKFIDNGVHRPFVMDQRRAHDGTLEFTSRDAHMGAHSRRSDLECLGYNLLFWSQGYLPWKDAATQQQQEKVHRAKEYLMTDVREMLKLVYGKQVPKYLGEFLHYVGQLAYHERPDYARYRRIFQREYQQLGYGSLSDMHLDSHEIVRTCVRVKEEIENKNDIFELNKNHLSSHHMRSIMKNLAVGTPFHERTLSNRVSPKNLRSKSDKKSVKKKKFSWAEILSQDPDQIARERAEKEFDREEELSEVQQSLARRYEGKPTYAIMEIQQRLKLSGRFVEEIENNKKENDDEYSDKECDKEDENDVEMEKHEEKKDHEDTEGNDINVNADDSHLDIDEPDEDDDEVEVNTNTTDDFEEMQTNVPKRRGRISKTAKITTSRKSLSKTPNEGRTRGTARKRASSCKNSKRTRTSTTSLSPTKKTTTPVSRKKRAKSRKGEVAAASAAGEVEHNTLPGHPETNHGPGVCDERPRERRTRRCLIKTDDLAAVENADDEDDSNSNFSPNVHSLFNVWKKITNETIYFRGSTAAARHCKK